jgi:hypothetical protein
MSSRAEDAALRLPLRLLLILTFCTGCLLVHFVAEDLAPAAHAPGQTGLFHLLCESCDENFVFPSLIGIPVELPSASPAILAVMDVPTFSTPPLQPPPNL